MLSHPLFPSLAGMLCLLAVLGGLTACDREEATEGGSPDPVFRGSPRLAGEVSRTRMDGEPTGLLRLQADAPVNWQPWSAELLENATAAQRPIFLVALRGQQQESFAILRAIHGNPAIISELHQHYVCALADVESSPELALALIHLAAESGESFSFPVAAWLTHEGHPIISTPLSPAQAAEFEDQWTNTHAMIVANWDDPRRVLVTAARRNHNGRLARIGRPPPAEVSAPECLRGATEAAARIAALYDPVSQTIDRSGDVIPSSVLRFASFLALDPATPAGLRRDLTRLVEGLTEAITKGAVLDPLDRGLFDARQGGSWELPVFAKDSRGQSEAILALAQAQALLGTETLLQPAAGIAEFARTVLGETAGGLGQYLSFTGNSGDDSGFLWAEETMEECLEPEEFEVAKSIFETRSLGNIPLEADPRRAHFRRNSLGTRLSIEDCATVLGRGEDDVRRSLETSRRRLLAHREELQRKNGSLFLEPVRIAATDARFARALTALGARTNDAACFAEARRILARLRAQHDTTESGLMRIAATEHQRGVRARGQDYAALLDALLALYRQDLEPEHLSWAAELAAEAVVQLANGNATLREAPTPGELSILPVEDRAMALGPSTWGTIYSPLSRLQLLSGQASYGELLSRLRAHLAPSLARSPLVHTDFARSVIETERQCVVVLAGSRSGEALALLHRVVLEPSFSAAMPLHHAPDLPEGFQLPEAGPSVSARVFRGKILVGETSKPAELRELLREALGSG